MTESAHLWAIGYDSIDRAEQVRAEAVRLGEKQSIILLDTAVAVRHLDGTVTLNGEPIVSLPYFTKHGIAGLLAGLALAVPPLTAPVASAIARAAHITAADVGISEDFIREVQAAMKPGTSVLFVLDKVADMTAVLHDIRGLGGTVLRTNVDMKHAGLLQSTLAGGDDNGD
jgi:uncharacterized membrane protein